MKVIERHVMPLLPGSMSGFGPDDVTVFAAAIVGYDLCVWSMCTKNATPNTVYELFVFADYDGIQGDGHKHVATVFDPIGQPLHVFWRKQERK